jgi:hypothetical protein
MCSADVIRRESAVKPLATYSGRGDNREREQPWRNAASDGTRRIIAISGGWGDLDTPLVSTARVVTARGPAVLYQFKTSVHRSRSNFLEMWGRLPAEPQLEVGRIMSLIAE